MRIPDSTWGRIKLSILTKKENINKGESWLPQQEDKTIITGRTNLAISKGERDKLALYLQHSTVQAL